MTRAWFLALLLLTLAGPLRAAPGDCGAIPATGLCSAGTLSYCEDPSTTIEHVVTVDCAHGIFPADITGLCITVNASYGADCAVPLGTRCAFVDAEGASVVAFCDGASPGCLIDDAAHSSRCVADLGPCTPPAEGESFAPSCQGNVLLLACQEGQPLGTDCAALGGICERGACAGLPVDAACDGVQRLCAGGLLCHAELARCVDPAASCDPATALAHCDGDALLYCATPHELWQRVDCTTALGAASGMTCGPAYSCVDDGSSGACATLPAGCIGASAGARCSVEQGLFCSSGLGCVLGLNSQGASEGRCAVTAACALGQAHAGCVGDVATTCVSDGERAVAEAAGFDCASLLSHCEVDAVAGPLCVGNAGARCDDPALVPGSPFRCAPGLICERSDQQLGTCALPAVDAGSADRAPVDAVAVDAEVDAAVDAGGSIDAAQDAGADAGLDAGLGDSGAPAGQDAGSPAAPDDGCGCQGAAPAARWPWLLGLPGGWLAMRCRRRR